MKRGILISVLFLLMFALVFAQTPGEISGGEEVEQIQNLTDTFVPIDPDTGEFDGSGFLKYKTQAQQDIDDINAWLEEWASWLSLAFGMVPAISWLFAWNIYFMLLFFVILVLNGEIFAFLFSFFTGSSGDTSTSVSSENKAKLVGLIFFIIFLVLKLYYVLALGAASLASVIWNVILPAGFWISIIIAILLLAGAAMGIPFAIRALAWIGQLLEKRKEAKAKANTAVDRKVLHTVVKEMQR